MDPLEVGLNLSQGISAELIEVPYQLGIEALHVSSGTALFNRWWPGNAHWLNSHMQQCTRGSPAVQCEHPRA